MVVGESTTNAWDFYDQTRPFVECVIVAHAGKIALIAGRRVKTDKVDVMKLARLSAAGLIPEVWVRPAPVMATSSQGSDHLSPGSHVWAQMSC